jgi:hypothetical protein
MAQAILVAILSGGTSALLSGLLTPGTVPFFVLFFLAPLPLMIVGLGWHALVAALGALIGLILVNYGVGLRGAIGFIGMVGLPAFGASLLFTRLFQETERSERDGDRLGQLYLVIAGYVALAMVLSSIAVQPDYAIFEASLHKMMQEAFKIMSAGASAPLPPTDSAGVEALISTMAGLIMPISALMIIATLVISGTLALMIVVRSNRLMMQAPDLRRLRLPGGALILFGIALFLGAQDSYIGLFCELIVIGIAIGFVLQGLAVLHVRLIGSPNRTLILGVAWALLVVFGVPALMFLILGMANHLMNFRRGRI